MRPYPCSAAESDACIKDSRCNFQNVSLHTYMTNACIAFDALKAKIVTDYCLPVLNGSSIAPKFGK